MAIDVYSNVSSVTHPTMDIDIYSNASSVNVSGGEYGPYTPPSGQPPSWMTVTVGVALTPIILLGTLGNIFSLLVWVKGRRRKSSTARYLSALAVCDMAVLCTGAMEFWMGYVLHTDIRPAGRAVCKLLYYLSYLGPTVSSWILVCVTVERALSVWIPHKITRQCRPVTASIVVCVTVLTSCLVYLPLPIGVDVVRMFTLTHSWLECSALSTSVYSRYLLIWLYLDLILYFLLPFLIILTCNVAIFAKVMCLAKKRKRVLKLGRRIIGGKTKGMLQTVTRRIVVLSVVFCICTAPISIMNAAIVTPSFRNIIQAQHVQILRVPFHILMYLNNGINFLLYCAIGSGFRRDLLGIFRPRSRSSSA